jgi:SOS-response transcriptional repressor LexA
MTGQSPTRGQRKIFDFIRRHFLEHGSTPSLREIARGTGYTSPGHVHAHVHALAKLGLLKLHPGGNRLIELVAANSLTVDLPNDVALALHALAERAGVTAEAVAIECIRDGVFGDRSLFASHETSRAEAAATA